MRTARLKWETYLIDYKIVLEKARPHPHCAEALITEVDNVIAKAVVIDQDLLAIDSMFRSSQQYDVKAATQPIKNLHGLMTTTKSIIKKTKSGTQ